MDLSIIIPVYNEKKTFITLLDRVVAIPVDKEIIIIDDGSVDGTKEILKSPEMKKRGILKIYFHNENRGKGAAIRTGLPYAEGDFVVIQDGDLEYDPLDLVTMLARAKNGNNVVYGSRILGSKNKSYLRYYLGGRLITFITNLFYKSAITDEPTCYKMFPRNLIQSLSLNCTGFEFCPEVTAKVLRSGVKIVEIPISYSPRKIQEGKKISWRDGLIALIILIRYRLTRG